MQNNIMVYTMFLIFAGAAIFSTLALYTRQSLLVGYIVLGVIVGPWGLGLIVNQDIIDKTGDIGIIFLLFLLGLHLQPRNLLHMMRKATLVTFLSSLIFAMVGFVIGRMFNFSTAESLVIGVSMMFSSTIIGLKLLPTTVLHHQHIGEIVISVLLLQDLLAIVVLICMHIATVSLDATRLGLIFLSLPLLLAFTFFAEYYILSQLFARFDRMREYIFLLAIAWCLSIAELSKLMGLTYEIGAFIAGVSIAEGPIALYIAESLKPLRDFFLVLFFFSIGASFDWHYIDDVAIPSILLAVVFLLLKPFVFWRLLRKVHENVNIAWEVGWRLGQVSEFSLLIAYIAYTTHIINVEVLYLIQAATILTFIGSSYIVVLRYPTPAALTEKLRRD